MWTEIDSYALASSKGFGVIFADNLRLDLFRKPESTTLGLSPRDIA